MTRTETVERRVPVRLRSLAEILNPQPQTAAVLHRLLDWIDHADQASQRGEPRPALRRADGAPLFPETQRWLTELERRNPEAPPRGEDDVIDEDEVTRNPAEAGAGSSSAVLAAAGFDLGLGGAQKHGQQSIFPAASREMSRARKPAKKLI